MSKPNSRLHAGPVERPTTVPAWQIGVLAILIGGALWLLFPKRDLERQLVDSRDDSELSLNYLTNLLKSDPENPRLRDLLEAKQQRMLALKQAQEEAARQALPSAAAQAWNHWQSLYTQYQQAQQQGHRAMGQARLLVAPLRQALLAVPREELTVEQTLYLASSALVLQDNALALSMFESLAQSQPAGAQRAALYAQAARQTLGMSLYAETSQLLLQASASATEPELARTYVLQAMAALQSGNRAKDALALAQAHADTLGDSPEMLRHLVELARAAGEPAVAERYVKRLLQLSLLQQWQHTRQLASAAFGGSADDGAWALMPMAAMAPAAASGWRMLRTAGPARSSAPALPFDDKVYQLGYEVFLENRNLEDAWRVAQAAVQQAPQNMAWQERLAQVSEWSGRGQQALDHWLILARSTGREDAWLSVLRLAPGLFDDRALIAGLHHQLEQQPSDPRLLQALVQAYERQGTPAPAIDYLRAHGKSPQARILLAQLAERAGQPELALQTWSELLQDPAQQTPAHAMPAAILALLQNQPALGLQWLEQAQSQVTPDSATAADYWRLTADLAQSLQKEPLALQAYRQLIETQDAAVSDFDELIKLLVPISRQQAAQVSLRAWDQFQEPRHLTQAIYLFEDHDDWRQVGPILHKAMADAQAREKLLLQPAFFHVSGLYFQRIGQPGQALAAFQNGLSLDPQSSLLRQSLLWLLIDTQNASALQAVLAQHEAAWASDPEMHGTLAAAYQAISRPAIALQRYLQPQRADNADDFLWMMNYADALEQNQQGDLAWRLRRSLWQQQAAQSQAADPQTAAGRAARDWLTPEGLEQVQRQARNRLLLSQAHGDDELALLRELLRLDLGQDRRSYSNAAAELAIAWLQERAEYSAERGYLWQQYARQRGKQGAAPLWAEITLALAQRDTAQAGQLLQRYDESLPRYDRINAAVLVGDVRLAQSAAFETQGDQPDDDALHQSLTEQLLVFSDSVGVDMSQRHLDGIDEQVRQARWHLALNPRWALDVEAEHVRRSVNNTAFVQSPSNERALGLRLLRRTDKASSEFWLGRRESLASYTPLQLSHQQTLGNRLSLQASLGRQLPTQDSLVLRMGGMKSRLAVGAIYQFSRLDQLSLEHAGERYQLQTGLAVGSGQHTTLQYTHTYRSDTPSIQWGAFTSWHNYRPRDLDALEGKHAAVLRYLPPGALPSMDYLLPGNFRFSGVQVSTNLRYAQEYTRALRPFASAALTQHSRNGRGYELHMGLATSVLGADHLMAGLRLTKSGVNNAGTTRELQLTYRLHY